MNKTTTTTTITKSSQITLPAKAQRALGVRPGDRVRVTIKEGSVELTVPRFPSIASLTGAAGQLEQPLSFRRMREIAQRDRFATAQEGDD